MNELNLTEFKFSEKDVKNFVNSSLDVEEGSILFIDNHDNNKLYKYVDESLKKKAKVVITSLNCSLSDDRVIKAKNYNEILHESYSYICDDYESKKYFGITGTDGKTTTGSYLKELLGPESLFIGTNEDVLFSEITNEKHLTSPKLFNILKLLGRSDFKKYRNIILEASSHALDQDRFNGIKFNTSGFTNLSQDHLDYHTNIENYFNSKLKLFSSQLSNKYVYIDNKWGNKISENTSIPSFKISSDTQGDLQILDKKTYPKTILKIKIDEKIYDFELDIIGPNFYQNFLLAFSMAYYSKIKNVDQIIENTSNLKNPKGRFDLIDFKTNKIIVDYAHTPESISKIIDYVNPYFMKVVVLFGAGGNRDKDKRKLMGNASQLADSVIVTNDNPRDEDPIQISNDVLNGCDLSKTTVILDRKEAITSAINELKENSVLLVLGKGHEMYQEINNSQIPFNDNDFINETIGGLI